ncbi:ACT domain-containing protein [Candidatus Micrarchaeota archaeon]|nr:ACT domain-containing protein [Candidatus Micrarchaeota archaeon]
MRTLVVVAEDKIGLLADISYVLGKSKINIEGVSVNVIGGKAVVGVVVKDDIKAKDVLTRSGYTVMETGVIVIKLEDKPGSLSEITKKLAEEGVAIQNVHIISKNGKYAVLALIVDKEKKARVLLKDYLVEENTRQ